MKHTSLDLTKIDVQPLNTNKMTEINGGEVFVTIAYIIAGVAICLSLIPTAARAVHDTYYLIKNMV